MNDDYAYNVFVYLTAEIYWLFTQRSLFYGECEGLFGLVIFICKSQEAHMSNTGGI